MCHRIMATSLSSRRGNALNMQPRKTSSSPLPSAKKASSRVSPFTFAHRSIAHEGHPEHNEDTVMVDKRRGLASIFDGVGGEDAGEVASQLGARVIRKAWKRTLQQQDADNSSDLLMLNASLNIEHLLYQLIAEAQSTISEEGERRGKAAATMEKSVGYPACTVVVAALCQKPGEKGYVMGYVHVGDSRIYLLRMDEPLQRLTQDDG